MTSHAIGGSTIAFLVIVTAVVIAFVAATRFAYRKAPRPERTAQFIILGLALWLVALSGLVASGLIERTPVPWLMIFFVASNGMAIGVAASRIGGAIATEVPIWMLVLFQGFRLPLELVLHAWAGEGAIPPTMTWTGANVDILSGIVAILAAWPARRSRAAAWFANGVGFVLLLNVMRVAILSSPLPFAWKLETPLVLAMHLPYALIVPVCVGGALAGHIVLTRALLKR